MKLITLNVWGGRKGEELERFFNAHADTDIFCFQEVYENAGSKDVHFQGTGANYDHLSLLKSQLSDYQCFYHPHLGDWWGLAIFIKKGIPVVDSGEIYVHKEKGWNFDLEVSGRTAKNLQYATIETEQGLRTIINFDGLWNGQGKEDSDERLLQSQNIVAYIKTLQNHYVLAGDFN